ncbi:MAG: deoxyguanosinetriphosphate triphosphohydrolase, partial [Trebonia sp.]
LTRATLDAALKYPVVGSGAGKYGAYESDISVFDWVRRDAPENRRCLEAQVMDWADDVAYSVHDLEDGLHAGLVTLKNLKSSPERSVVAPVAARRYCSPAWNVADRELETVFAEFMDLPFWDFTFDGGPASLAAVKNLTSELVGRFCQAAEQATLAQAATDVMENGSCGVGSAGSAGADGEPRLSRYAADLTVPRRQLLECALLKAVSAHYVIFAESSVAPKARERELITELASAILAGAPGTLDPVLRPSWDAGASDAERRRVVVDQVASLTDTSAIAWHDRLC